jgi:hypothetical protein
MLKLTAGSDCIATDFSGRRRIGVLVATMNTKSLSLDRCRLLDRVALRCSAGKISGTGSCTGCLFRPQGVDDV